MSSGEKKDLESMRNEDRIKRLEIELDKLKAKLQNDMDNMDSAIDEDNRLRDREINEISNNLASLRLFIREKLSDHPNDYFNYVNHRFSQLNAESDTSSVASDDSFAGGRRKKKTRKKKRRRSKKKTKKKY